MDSRYWHSKVPKGKHLDLSELQIIAEHHLQCRRSQRSQCFLRRRMTLAILIFVDVCLSGSSRMRAWTRSYRSLTSCIVPESERLLPMFKPIRTVFSVHARIAATFILANVSMLPVSRYNLSGGLGSDI